MTKFALSEKQISPQTKILCYANCGHEVMSSSCSLTVSVPLLSAEEWEFVPVFLGLHLPLLHPNNHLGAWLLEILKDGGSWSISHLLCIQQEKNMMFSPW